MSTHGRFACFGGMTWPLPDSHTADPEEGSVEWKLRYGEPSEADKMYAASILGAYSHLIEMPERRRREVIRGLREEMGVK